MCNLHAQVVASSRRRVVTVHQCINICCFKLGANRPANRLAVWRPGDIRGTYLACAAHGEGRLRRIEIDTCTELRARGNVKLKLIDKRNIVSIGRKAHLTSKFGLSDCALILTRTVN